MAKQGRDGTTEAAAATSAAKSAVLQVRAKLLQGEWVMARNRIVTHRISRSQVKRDDACIVDCFPGMDATERLVPSELLWTVTVERKKPELPLPPTRQPGDYDSLGSREFVRYRSPPDWVFNGLMAALMAVCVVGLGCSIWAAMFYK